MNIFQYKNIAIIATLLCFLAPFTLFSQSRTDSVHVADYSINLDITDFANQAISGFTDLKVVVKIDDIAQLRLDLLQLTVDSVFADSQPATFSHVGQNLFVNVPQKSSGDTTIVRVFYHGAPAHDDAMGGFYFSGEYAYNVGVALYNQPHNYGRCWFPCIDEFTDKSTFTFNILTEQWKMAVCNGLLTDSLSTADGYKIWSWRMDLPMPTYLASVAVGDYVCYSDTVQGIEKVIPIQIFATPSNVNKVAPSFVNLKSVLHLFEDLFGAYPWQRIGYVCVSMTGGAMEHTTNIAYPNLFVDGGLTYQDVYAHELFHHWFGDLITCSRAEEMWINEGFASYSEALVEGLLNSTETYDAYIDYIRTTHNSVLADIVKYDGGHYALDAVPQEVTYGMHSYQKGSLVIHSLRAYMGDELFFSSLKQLLSQYAYKNITSEEFFVVLSEISGIDLNNFYEDWIHQPGFLDFHVADLSAHGCGMFSVLVEQSGYGIEHVGTNVPVDITFVSEDREFYTVENQYITGDSTEFILFVPFSPVFAIVNYSDKLSDAAIDGEATISSTGTYNFTGTNFSASVSELFDTAYLRVENHYVAPSNINDLPDGIFMFSQTHYWDVRFAGVVPDGSFKFRVQCGSPLQLDYNLLNSGYSIDNLKLMYRMNDNDSWSAVNYSRTGSPYNFTLSILDMLPGQYCLAMGDETIDVADYQANDVEIFPNPAKNSIVLNFKSEKADLVKIIDYSGRLVKEVLIDSKREEIDVSSLSSGNYIVVLYDKGNKRICSKKVVISK